MVFMISVFPSNYFNLKFISFIFDIVEKIENRNYMVGLLNNKEFKCGAVIVSKYKILTAAHCVYQKESVSLKFGTLHLGQTYFDRIISREEIIIHPEFSKKIPYVNNIAVILLKNMLNFDQKIGQIEMVGKDFKLEEESPIIALGYSNSTRFLQFVRSINAPFHKCHISYWERNKYYLIKENKQLCFGLDIEKRNTISTFDGGKLDMILMNKYLNFI